MRSSTFAISSRRSSTRWQRRRRCVLVLTALIGDSNVLNHVSKTLKERALNSAALIPGVEEVDARVEHRSFAVRSSSNSSSFASSLRVLLVNPGLLRTAGRRFNGFYRSLCVVANL